MAWVFLGIAGLMEVFWSTCLKLSEGFTKLGFSALTVVGMLVSFGLLSQAMKTLPLGTAYGIWTGIGALGAVILGLVLFKEPATAWRMFFAALLLIGIVGLKISKSRIQKNAPDKCPGAFCVSDAAPCQGRLTPRPCAS